MKHHEQRPRDNGFTLVELLVVITIIGVLAAIALPTYVNQRSRAWRAEAVSDMKHATIAVESHVVDPTRSYAHVNGATQTSPLLRSEDFRPGSWVQFRIVSTPETYCIQAVHVRLPAATFVYRSTRGELEVVGVNGAAAC